MKNFFNKKTGRAFTLGLFLCLVITSCNTKPKNSGINEEHISGKAQGSTFSISYFDESSNNKKKLEHSIDSVFTLMDNLFSHWVDASAINELNNNKSLTLEGNKAFHFNTILNLSDSVYRFSKGLFDVSIYPLVKKWGFGKNVLDSNINYQKALDAVSFKRIYWKYNEAVLTVEIDSNQSLDFNSIAQGYTVDILADLLESFNIKSYLIEVGGELRIGNKKPDGNLWGVGIDKPKDKGKRELIDTIYTENTALATSGSYRKYYEKNGKKYSHSISPKTGKPVEHNLLSISVLAKNKNCALADAYATAIMIMGKEKSKEKFEDLSGFNLLYISGDSSAFKTEWQR